MSEYLQAKPNEQIRVAILFQDPSLWTAIESFYDALINDSRFSVNIFVLEKPEFTYEAQSNFLKFFNFEFTEYSFERLLWFAPHAILLQTPYDYTNRPLSAYSMKFKKAGIRVIYIPYGIEIVDTPSARYDHFRMPVINNAYRIYVLSELFANEYKKYCGNYKAVRAVGLPRFDVFSQKEKYRLPDTTLELANGRKIVVWHTHFPKKSNIGDIPRLITPYLDEYINFANKLNEYTEYFFIFQPHPKFGRDVSTNEFKAQTDEIFSILEHMPNVYIDYSDDYHAALMSADAFISDRSSLLVEVGACDIPVLYMKNSDFEEKAFPPLERLFSVYTQGTSCSDMINFLWAFDNEVDANKEIRNKAFKSLAVYLDGACGKRIAEDLYDSITTETTAVNSDKIKIVLFGVGFLFSVILSQYTFPPGCEIVAVSDNDNNKWDKIICGYEVVPPCKLKDIYFDKIIIMINGDFTEQIYGQLRFTLEIPDCKIEFLEYLSTL
jgi:hypothetical protein